MLMCGNPAVGKSTWIQKVGAEADDASTSLYFDGLRDSTRRRGQWWEG